MDPADLEGVRAPDAAPAPGLVGGERDAGQRDHEPPGGAAGARFRDQPGALVTTVGSPGPARHVLSVVAWADGPMFSCVAGALHAEVPGPAEVRAGLREVWAA
ncbi:hypothetical protein ACVV2G_12145 [Streptomyces ziwulingensis]